MSICLNHVMIKYILLCCRFLIKSRGFLYSNRYYKRKTAIYRYQRYIAVLVYSGGDEGRTPNFLNAVQALSQHKHVQ